MDRRDVLKSAGLSVVGLSVFTLAACEQGTETADHQARPGSPAVPQDSLESLLLSLKGIDFVGPACVDELAGEDPLESLRARLDGSDPRDPRASLQLAMAQDHADRNWIDVGDWQLSRTECFLLASAALAQGLREPARTGQHQLTFSDFADVERWGPNETIEGEVFNEVGQGRGAFWVRVKQSAPASTRLVLGGITLATHFEPGVVTGSMEPEQTQAIVASPGMHQLMMVDIATNRAQILGHLTVRPRPPAALLANGQQSTVFCEVERWGPDHAPLGQAFNEQPDGSAAFWVRVGCAPESAILELDGRALPTTVRSGLVTARVAFYQELTTGDHTLSIRDDVSGERLVIGTFRVL